MSLGTIPALIFGGFMASIHITQKVSPPERTIISLLGPEIKPKLGHMGSEVVISGIYDRAELDRIVAELSKVPEFNIHVKEDLL